LLRLKTEKSLILQNFHTGFTEFQIAVSVDGRWLTIKRSQSSPVKRTPIRQCGLIGLRRSSGNYSYLYTPSRNFRLHRVAAPEIFQGANLQTILRPWLHGGHPLPAPHPLGALGDIANSNAVIHVWFTLIYFHYRLHFMYSSSSSSSSFAYDCSWLSVSVLVAGLFKEFCRTAQYRGSGERKSPSGVQGQSPGRNLGDEAEALLLFWC